MPPALLAVIYPTTQWCDSLEYKVPKPEPATTCVPLAHVVQPLGFWGIFVDSKVPNRGRGC